MDQEIYENISDEVEDVFNFSEILDSSFYTSPPTALQYSSFVLSIVTCVFGFPANIMVIFITGFLMKKNKYKIWFLNLALADFTILLFLPFHALSVKRGRWLYESGVCKFYTFITFINFYASIYILTALNIDRALAIAKPIWHRRIYSRRFSCCMCAAIWVSSILCSAPTIIYSDVHEGSVQCVVYSSSISISVPLSAELKHANDSVEDDRPPIISPVIENASLCISCENETTWNNPIFNISEKSSSRIKYILTAIKLLTETREFDSAMMRLVVSLIVIGYIIPLCVILVSNIIIALHVKNSKMATPSRLYRVVIAAVMSFFCTRTPFVCTYITLFASVYTMQFTLMDMVSSIVPLLYSISATNSLLNPVVYVLVGKQVRSKIRNIFRKT